MEAKRIVRPPQAPSCTLFTVKSVPAPWPKTRLLRICALGASILAFG